MLPVSANELESCTVVGTNSATVSAVEIKYFREKFQALASEGKTTFCSLLDVIAQAVIILLMSKRDPSAAVPYDPLVSK